MATPKIQVEPELVAEGRRLYETTTTTIADIAAMMGIKRRTLENRIVEWNWKRRRQPSGAFDIFHAIRGATIAAETSEPVSAKEAAAQSDSPQRCAAIAERIRRVLEREMAAIERIAVLLDKHAPTDQPEAERMLRTVAGISRALLDVDALNKQNIVAPPDEADDDPIPLDIDEFRLELARRIRGLIEKHRNDDNECADRAVARIEAPRV